MDAAGLSGLRSPARRLGESARRAAWSGAQGLWRTAAVAALAIATLVGAASIGVRGLEAADAFLRFDVEGTSEASRVIDFDSPGVRETLSAVNVFRALAVEPGDGSDWSVFLRYTDGKPALLTRELKAVSERGGGRIALFTSSLDTAWSDLPYRPAGSR